MKSLMRASCCSLDTGWCCLYSIENSPLPCVLLRMTVLYPNISLNGTSDLISTWLASSFRSELRIRPPRLFRPPISTPWNSAGASTSRLITGARICGLPAFTPWRIPYCIASWKDKSLESTACAAPSVITTRIPDRGWPASTPFSQAALAPFSQLGMNSGGILVPIIWFSNSNSTPFFSSSSSRGSTKPITLAYCPDPPDCFLCR
mmetsp:Transcript_10326/g.22903  ORF Transcript_10326/g.22903 Transcript_10326/m.22903 type:complete len:205 (-) Transcript_10326:1673-2287(-)